MTRRYFVTRGGRERTADVTAAPQSFQVRLDGGDELVEVTLLGRGDATTVSVGGRVVTLLRAANGEVVAERARTSASPSARSTQAARRGGGAGDAGTLVRSPMPGRVLKVLVAEVASVNAGAPVVVIEAMKMENELVAARSGVVKSVRVRAGDAVERDAPLLELE
jgi:biotin carboxyl carrier protein